MAEERPHNESGQFDDRIPAETAIDVFEARDDLARPLTAGDVADGLGCARRTALNKLNELEAAGSVESRRVGGRARVFWVPVSADAETRLKRLSVELSEPITVGSTVYEDGDFHPLDGPARAASDRHSETVEGETTDVAENAASDDVTALDLPGRGRDLERRQAALRAVLDHLREHGETQASELKEIAWEADGGSYASKASLWKNCVLKRGLSKLDTVETSGQSGRWRWVGADQK